MLKAALPRCAAARRQPRPDGCASWRRSVRVIKVAAALAGRAARRSVVSDSLQAQDGCVARAHCHRRSLTGRAPAGVPQRPPRCAVRRRPSGRAARLRAGRQREDGPPAIVGRRTFRPRRLGLCRARRIGRAAPSACGRAGCSRPGRSRARSRGPARSRRPGAAASLGRRSPRESVESTQCELGCRRRQRGQPARAQRGCRWV
jgi:hypothetical protein